MCCYALDWNEWKNLTKSSRLWERISVFRLFYFLNLFWVGEEKKNPFGTSEPRSIFSLWDWDHFPCQTPKLPGISSFKQFLEKWCQMIDVSFLAKTPKVLADIHSLKPQINHRPNPCVGVRCFLLPYQCARWNLIVWQVSADDWPGVWFAVVYLFPRSKDGWGLGLGAKWADHC